MESLHYPIEIDELIAKQFHLELAMAKHPTHSVLKHAYARTTERLDLLTNGQTIFHDMAADEAW